MSVSVNHSHLFSALRSVGIGDGFLSLLCLLYSGAHCMVKVEAGLRVG